MLYPQYDHYFAQRITPDTWRWLQEKARHNLAEYSGNVHSAVYRHWEQIVAGVVPFGYEVGES
jgi:hypothetical protein